MIADAHCHFFSQRFLGILTKGTPLADQPVSALCERLGWDTPGTPEALADRWVEELDKHGVSRAALKSLRAHPAYSATRACCPAGGAL